MSVVSLPVGFVATKFPGYFWNIEQQKLYSIKVDGILTPMTVTKPSRYNLLHEPAYRVSVKGRRRYLHLADLKKLILAESVIPVAEKR